MAKKQPKSKSNRTVPTIKAAVHRIFARHGKFVPIGVVVLAAALAIYAAVLAVPPLAKVWLPKNLTDLGSGRRDGVVSMEQSVSFEYGRAVIFYGDNQGLAIAKSDKAVLFEAPVSTRLRPELCPNVFRIDELSPTPCTKVGSVRGSAVYSLSRRLPSTTADFYWEQDGVFIGYRQAFGEHDYDSFMAIPFRQVSTQLAANKRAITAANDAAQKKQTEQEKAQKEAYRHLRFAPTEPKVLPKDWDRYLTQIYGADPTHPVGAELYYEHKVSDSYQTILFYTSHRDTFTYQNFECGPAQYWGKPSVPCTQIAADTYMGISATSTYMYKLVGDVLVMGVATEPNPGPVGLPLETALRQMMAEFHTVPVDTYKSAGYDVYPN